MKAAGAYGWQPYHLRVPNVLKSGSLNLLEPSGPVQACNGIAANMCDFCETSGTPVFHSTPILKCQRHGYTCRLAVTAGIKNLSFWHRWARHVIRSVVPTRQVIRSVLSTRHVIRSVLPTRHVIRSVLSTRHVIRSVLPTRHVIRSVLPTRTLPIQSYLYVTAMLILSINFLRTLFKFMECVCTVGLWFNISLQELHCIKVVQWKGFIWKPN